MRIAELTTTNWLPFRGVHKLALEPRVYGVIARWDDDPERSNWGGKSALLAAVRFVLFGAHPADSEDEWITNGEGDGGVLLVLDTGERIARTRIRGKATRLRLDLPDGGELHDKEAQAEIVRRVGLDDKDFVNVCFFVQKRFSQFVTATAGTRMEIVRAWLDLDPLYGARDRVAATLRQLLKDEGLAETRLAAEQQRERETLATVGGAREGLADRMRDAGERAEAARERAAGLERTGEEAARRRRDAGDLARWEVIERELRGISPVADTDAGTNLVQLRKKLSVAQVAEADAGREVRTARSLEAGEFDGACPLLRGFECPAEETINGKRAEHRKAVSVASARLDAAKGEVGRAQAVVREGEAEETAAARRRGRQDALAAEQARLAPAAERARRWAGLEPETDANDELARLRAEFRSAGREAFEAEQAIGALAAGDRRQEAIARDLATYRGKIAANQEALAVLALARRTIADEALEAIAVRANGLLDEAGIGLSLEVSWMREVKGALATSCDGCGAPYGSSQRVKECASCGATRGPKFAEELELRVSSRSGAADDLAGLVFCLAAGAWLRARRSSGWSVAFLDEPFGALDPTHRRLLAAHLQSMLASRHGFSQAFVVAHEAGVMDGLPGRVVVSASPEFSSVEVSR